MNRLAFMIMAAAFAGGCTDDRRALLLSGEIEYGLGITSAAQGDGCYVRTSAEQPDVCVTLTSPTCNIKIGECAQ